MRGHRHNLYAAVLSITAMLADVWPSTENAIQADRRWTNEKKCVNILLTSINNF